MNNSKLLSIDLTEEEAFFKSNPEQSFRKVYRTKLIGRTLIHEGHSAGEYKEHSCQQHSIVVNLKPEQTSLRRLEDNIEVENPKVGDMTIIPAEVNHWLRINSEVCEAIVLTIEPQLVSQIAYETINPDRVKLLPTFAKPDPLIYGIALNLKANLDSSGYDKLYTESLFNTLSVHLLHNYSTTKPIIKEVNGLTPFQVKQVFELVGDRLSKNISVLEMANYVGFSPSHFVRQFKQSVGLTPHKYVIQQRVEKAKRLLKKPDLSIARLALDCGFSNQSHLSREFKKYTGTTPKQYRKSF